jgi:VWFA-related protein
MLLAATAACAQQTPPPPVADPGQLSADPGQLPESDLSHVSTLQVNVRRVVVDVVVTDAHGHPVANLDRDAFHLSEDGKPQPLRSFEPHIAQLQPPAPLPALPPNTVSNLALGPQNGPVTVILYDLLNTPLDAQPFAHDQLLQFLKQRKTSSQTAIFVLSDRLHMLQGFTDDENQLIAALNAQTAQAHKSTLLQSGAETTQQSDALARTEGNQNASADDQNFTFQTISGMLKHMETVESSALLDRRVYLTADALEEIARFLVGLPGRKNLLWLSGSFPTGILPDASLGGRDSLDVTRNYSATVMKASDLLNLSHVAVYPVDVRGLQVNPMFSAASNQTFEPGSGRDLKAVDNFRKDQTAGHATMDTMADETGGRAFYNTNGLKEAVATAVDDGSTYYTLTYAPSNTTVDGRLRHVSVELTGPNASTYKLAYRRSYFADNLDAKAQAAADTPTDPLTSTLQHGAPAARELFFEAHLQTYGPPEPATDAQLEVLAQYEARSRPTRGNSQKPTKPANAEVIRNKTPVLMQRYVITYGLLLRQLTLTSAPDGSHRGNLEFAIMSYDSDGLALNGIRSTIADIIRPDRYEHIAASGYEVVQTVAVPVTASSLRLAVRDNGSNQLGSTEVRLPLAPTPTAPTNPSTTNH